MTAKRLTANEILHAAAAHIESVGWHQGSSFEDWENKAQSRCCLIGALCLVSGFYNDRGHASPELDKYPQKAIDKLQQRLGGGLITFWNDQPGRTREEVLALLRSTGDSQ